MEEVRNLFCLRTGSETSAKAMTNVLITVVMQRFSLPTAPTIGSETLIKQAGRCSGEPRGRQQRRPTWRFMERPHHAAIALRGQEPEGAFDDVTASWSVHTPQSCYGGRAVALHRFVDLMAPEDWRSPLAIYRSPKPGGESNGSWKVSKHNVIRNCICYIPQRRRSVVFGRDQRRNVGSTAAMTSSRTAK